MPHEFEVRDEIALEATPEQVWDAIATGPGIDSWFMGRNEIESREGGRGRMTIGGHTEESTVTAWEPARRFAIRGDQNPDGTFMAFEYLIEGRGGGSTVLRFVHSGLLGDDWEDQFDAVKKGDHAYLMKLAVYLKHFPGRTSEYSLFVPGPQVPDKARVDAAFKSALGLAGTTGTISEGQKVRLSVEGLAPAEGTVAFAASPVVCVRTSDAIYAFIHGFRDAVVVECHSFSGDPDRERAEEAWRSWLGRSFAQG
ncbi:MAG: SRPBCC family protein [Micromonosporaceae bacterium]